MINPIPHFIQSFIFFPQEVAIQVFNHLLFKHGILSAVPTIQLTIIKLRAFQRVDLSKFKVHSNLNVKFGHPRFVL